jgi:hypothetical protein
VSEHGSGWQTSSPRTARARSRSALVAVRPSSPWTVRTRGGRCAPRPQQPASKCAHIVILVLSLSSRSPLSPKLNRTEDLPARRRTGRSGCSGAGKLGRRVGDGRARRCSNSGYGSSHGGACSRGCRWVRTRHGRLWRRKRQRGKLRPVSVEGVMGEFSRMTHHIYCTSLQDDLPSLNAQGHSTSSFHKFMCIFNCCILVGQLCLKIVSTCLSGRVT